MHGYIIRFLIIRTPKESLIVSAPGFVFIGCFDFPFQVLRNHPSRSRLDFVYQQCNICCPSFLLANLKHIVSGGESHFIKQFTESMLC